MTIEWYYHVTEKEVKALLDCLKENYTQQLSDAIHAVIRTQTKYPK